MAQKNDTPALVAALLITAGLIGGGLWWFTRQSGVDPTAILDSTPEGPYTPWTLPTGQPGAQQFRDVQQVPSGLFSYGGSTTWAPIRGTLDPVLQAAQPGFQLRYVNPISGAPGSATGIQMLISGQLAFAQSSRPPRPDELQQAQQRGSALREIPVTLEGIAIAVHPDLAVAGLTIDQLRGIYTGQITNWNQVGGPNLPVMPYSRPVDGGTVEFFIENVLGGSSLGGNVQILATTTEALRRVSAEPGGIYYASAPEVVGQCTTKPLPIGRQANQWVAPYVEPLVPPSQCPSQRNQINAEALRTGQYPITRPLYVIVKQNGQIEQQAGEAYANLLLTDEGQQLLSQMGFVRIR